MLKLERVKVADIEPLRDEYGNEFVSRDYELPANKAYVAELAESFGESGEPDEPIKLIRNGAKFAIKAGNSRVRAMQLLGTEECWAVIDDDDTVQGVVETVVRTDKKKKYEETELSRFVQQLAAFGDDEYVGHVASIDADHARRVRKAREMVGIEKAEQLSLERLYVIPDFEGDDEAVKKLEEAPEVKWRIVEDQLRREKARREARAAFEARAQELRIKLVEDFTQARGKGRQFACSCRKPEDLEADYMAASVEYTGLVGVLQESWSGVELNLYGKKIGTDETAEDAERRRLANEYEATAQSIEDSAHNWVLEQFEEAGDQEFPQALRNLNDAARKITAGMWWMRDVIAKLPRAMEQKESYLAFCIGYHQESSSYNRMEKWAGELASDEIGERATQELSERLAWIELHEADGWVPDEGQTAFLEMARERVTSASEAAEGEK